MSQKRVEVLTVGALLVVGALLRFHNLNWDQGLGFHPDEYHIVISVNQLNFPTQMNPHFFSYGTFIIYLIYFTKLLLPGISSFLIGRFYSALFSTLTLPLIYLISRKILNTYYSLLATLLVALTPGLIQQAHFTTPESTQIFFILGSLYFLMRYHQLPLIKNIIGIGVSLGLAVGVKVSSLVVAPIVFMGILFTQKNKLQDAALAMICTFLISLLTLVIFTPFIFLDFNSFKANFDYESSLAIGNIPVFYTRQFLHTIPILFQVIKIYPFTLGPALEVFGLIGLGLMIFSLIRHRLPYFPYYILCVAYFLTLFFFNSLLFAKWTRFVSPTFPFFAIFSAFFLSLLSNSLSPRIFHIVNSTFLVLTLFWSLAFLSIYTRPDVRIITSNWLEQNLPSNSKILLEEGNTIDLPLKGQFIKLPVNFYNLEADTATRTKLITLLGDSDFFLVQSRRVFMNHNSEDFPKTAKFYDELFSGKLGFKKIKTFTSYPSLEILNYKLEFPDETGEETWSVFDHPVIRLYQKVQVRSRAEYEEVFND